MSKEPYAVLALNAIEPTRRHLKVTDFGSMVTVAGDASTRRADPESTAKEGWANNFAVFRSPLLEAARFSRARHSGDPVVTCTRAPGSLYSS